MSEKPTCIGHRSISTSVHREQLLSSTQLTDRRTLWIKGQKGEAGEGSVSVTTSTASRGEGSPSGPAVALWRAVGALTQEQALRLRREIQLLADTTVDAASPPKHGEGVRARHSRSCPGPCGGICSCSPRCEAWVYSRKDHTKVRKSFAEYWEAKAWRHEQA